MLSMIVRVTTSGQNAGSVVIRGSKPASTRMSPSRCSMMVNTICWVMTSVRTPAALPCGQQLVHARRRRAQAWWRGYVGEVLDNTQGSRLLAAGASGWADNIRRVVDPLGDAASVDLLLSLGVVGHSLCSRAVIAQRSLCSFQDRLSRGLSSACGGRLSSHQSGFCGSGSPTRRSIYVVRPSQDLAQSSHRGLTGQRNGLSLAVGARH